MERPGFPGSALTLCVPITLKNTLHAPVSLAQPPMAAC